MSSLPTALSRSTFEPLFDPAVSRPPTDAIELYLHAPLSTGILHMEALRGGRPALADAVERAHDAGLAGALEYLSGVVALKVGPHSQLRRSRTSVGEFRPGRLRLTTTTHLLITIRDGRTLGDIARPHHHIYLARSGHDEKGREWPIDAASLWVSAEALVSCYQFALQRSLADELGVQWSQPGEFGSDEPELVAPPLAEYVGNYTNPVCRPQGSATDLWDLGRLEG